MSGFNGYSLMVNKTSPLDLGATSAEVQWEYIVSYCRSHPTDFIVKAIQDLQLKLLQKEVTETVRPNLSPMGPWRIISFPMRRNTSRSPGL